MPRATGPYSRRVFDKIGYVDESLTCEDVEFNYRVEKAGWVIHGRR